MGISEVVTIALTCLGGGCLIYEDIRLDRTNSRIYQQEQRLNQLNQMTGQRTIYLLNGLQTMHSTARSRFENIEQRVRGLELMERSRPLGRNSSPAESSPEYTNDLLRPPTQLPRVAIAAAQGYPGNCQDLIHAHEPY